MLLNKGKLKQIKTSIHLQKPFFTENEKSHIKQLIKKNRFTCINNFLKENGTLTAEEKLFLLDELKSKKQTITKALQSHQQLVSDLKVNTTVGVIAAGTMVPTAALAVLETTVRLALFASENHWTDLFAASHVALTGSAITYLLATSATRCLKIAHEALLDERYIPVGKYTLQRYYVDIERLTLQLNSLKTNAPHQIHIDTAGC